MMDLIEKLSAQLGQTAEATWQILLTQAKIAAVTNFIAGGIFILLAITSIVLGCTIQRTWERDDNDKAGVAIGILFTLAFLGFSLAFILPAITAIINPQFWALHKLLEMIQ